MAVVGLQRRETYYRTLNVAGDALFTYLLLYIGGTRDPVLGWAGLMPLTSASLYFGLPAQFSSPSLNPRPIPADVDFAPMGKCSC